jgi:hypothetical protein
MKMVREPLDGKSSQLAAARRVAMKMAAAAHFDRN